ncbi:hypothetical protein [Salipaludibacillus aurantiacus]|uniref:DUF1641 domain-containing protein n=1 Tax=Salipaludibacillus aurantiacus TaxID=1601833 RepID=A0A1H9WIU2_9BACI|nr:hypothetical protein [Salipaludibacillus aurantiacus]SES33669.1 hypothetical protein SAMN05518684_11743 [Salipaludibacillus aurantiacus]
MTRQAEGHEPRWAETMKHPEVQESMTYLLRKLPEIQAAVESLDQIVQFGQQTFQDRKSMDYLEDQISLSSIDQESIEAFVKLIGKIPVLLKLVERIEEMATFAESVWNDRESLAYMSSSISQNTLTQKSKELWEKADHIQALAEQNKDEHISIFTVMKWMKDPSVQKSLRYAKATLQVMNNK